MEKKSSNGSIVTCRICSQQFKSITDSHLKMHGISRTEYNILFYNNMTECAYKSSHGKHKDQKCRLSTTINSQFCILHDSAITKCKEDFYKVFNLLKKVFENQNSAICFDGINFPDDIDFSRYIFQNDVSFVGCKFNGKALFRETVFNGHANFNRTAFYYGADFEHAVFNDYAHFTKLTCSGKFIFRWTKFINYLRILDWKASSTLYEIIFEATQFIDPQKISIADIDASKTYFRWTKISDINFETVKWPRTSFLLSKRRYIADETYIREIKKNASKYYIYTQSLYQQLRKNYESKGSYSESSDFYYGEMECFRKQNYLRRYLPSLVNLYRISSGYGQKYVRAGFILISMVIIYAALQMFLGLNPQSSSLDFHSINYLQNDYPTSINEVISDFCSTLIYCGEVIIREDEQDRLFMPASIPGEAINLTFTILVYIQALFFSLALNTRYKKR